jgi:hypothetical protein
LGLDQQIKIPDFGSWKNGKMKSLIAICVAAGVILGCAVVPEKPSKEEPQNLKRRQEAFDRARQREPAKTPQWVNAIPDSIGDILVERHLYKDGEVWGLAKRDPALNYQSKREKQMYDEIGSAVFISYVKEFNLYDKVGGWSEEARKKAIKFWQSWQDPNTGRFIDPCEPDRVVNEKYIVGILKDLGSESLYPHTTTSDTGKIDTKVFLERTKDDPDWEKGGWGVGSHTGFMAVEICNAINNGQTELIPDLEKGLEQILTHQDPHSGLWGPPTAYLSDRIGGTLKVVGRVYFALGMKVPYTRELADLLIEHQKNGDWFKCLGDPCVQRNVVEVAAYCLEASDYRRQELLETLKSIVEDYRAWVDKDSRTLLRRNDPNSPGINVAIIYSLGICGAYLHWEDCRLSNPLAGSGRGFNLRYSPILQENGKVRIIDTLNMSR